MSSDRTLQSPGAPAASAPEPSAGSEARPSEISLGPELPPSAPPLAGPDSSHPPPLPQDAQLERALVEALAAPGSAAPGVLVDGKYVVLNLLGEGGMSRVFEAKNHLTGRRVALKWLHGRGHAAGVDPQRLIQEARATARIEHPNVVQILDLGFVAGQPYLVMELLRGEALDLLLARQGPLPALEAAAWLEPVLGAAHRFHEAGVVHRDLKPANLFVVQDGVSQPYLKVLDFGIASLVPNAADGEESLLLTQPGMVLGTPFYMAPEQLRRQKADARSDVFALGCILYEMSTGERPFPARDLSGLLELLSSERAEDRRERLASTVPELAGVLTRALEIDPKDRFQSAEEFRQALRALLEGKRVASGRVSSGATPEPSPRTLRRGSHWRAMALVAALLAVSWITLSRWVPGWVASDPVPELPSEVATGAPPAPAPASPQQLELAAPANQPSSTETRVSGLRPAQPREDRTATQPKAPAASSPNGAGSRGLSTSSVKLDESDF